MKAPTVFDPPQNRVRAVVVLVRLEQAALPAA